MSLSDLFLFVTNDPIIKTISVPPTSLLLASSSSSSSFSSVVCFCFCAVFCLLFVVVAIFVLCYPLLFCWLQADGVYAAVATCTATLVFFVAIHDIILFVRHDTKTTCVYRPADHCTLVGCHFACAVLLCFVVLLCYFAVLLLAAGGWHLCYSFGLYCEA